MWSIRTRAKPCPTTSLATTVLDAGASISVNGPKGVKPVPKADGGVYFSTLSTAADYLDAGAYTVTGPGGADVPAFSAQTTMPPALVWTNQAASTTVTRANGLPITWTGGDPSGFIQITGTSFLLVNSTTFAGSSFVCTARTSAGAFTVPAIALLALPASGTISAGAIGLPCQASSASPPPPRQRPPRRVSISLPSEARSVSPKARLINK